MKYAIISLSGKQYSVKEGDVLEVDRSPEEPGKSIVVDQVLLVVGEGVAKIGTPYVEGASVALQVKEHLQGEKIRVATYKAKSRQRKVKGHRQQLTSFTVTSITS